MQAIDAIGDIHGHADALEALLTELGYADRGGAWRHPSRHAVFVGDFVDRGPYQLETLDLVRRMIDAGAASACMGNHEYNAIAWFEGAREHSEHNRHQHSAFLAAVGEGSGTHAEWVSWFKALPLWLDLPGARVVHACWHPASMAALAPLVDGTGALTESGLARTLDRDDPSFAACEVVLKGVEAQLPPGVTFTDAYGHVRRRTRTAWWDESATDFHRAALVDQDTRSRIPATPLPSESIVACDGGKPVMFGHYWMTGPVGILGPRRACLDFSVAAGGRLAAYRHDGEPTLCASRMVSVPATPEADDVPSAAAP